MLNLFKLYVFAYTEYKKLSCFISLMKCILFFNKACFLLLMIMMSKSVGVAKAGIEERYIGI